MSDAPPPPKEAPAKELAPAGAPPPLNPPEVVDPCPPTLM